MSYNNSWEKSKRNEVKGMTDFVSTWNNDSFLTCPIGPWA